MANSIKTELVGFRNQRFLLLTLIILVADQLLKYWTVTTLEYGQVIDFVSGMDLTRRHNPGAAFSILANAGAWKQFFFLGLAALVSLYILNWLRRNQRDQRMVAVGLALVLAGALGNTIDRVVYSYVVDMLLFTAQWPFSWPESWAGRLWPAFNIADVAISVGVVLLLIDGFFLAPKRERAEV